MSSTGTFIGHTSHDECGSSDGLALYDKGDRTDGYCFACAKWVQGETASHARQKLGNLVIRVKTPEELIAEVVNVYNNYQVRALADRSIDAATAAYFDVRAGVSQNDGVSISEHFYPYYANGHLQAYKKRVCADKHFYWVGDKKGTELFGQYQARATGSKRLIVTEGECDAMAAFQMLRETDKGTEWAHLVPAVVSISSGAANAVKELAAQLPFLNTFEEIVLCFDGDEAGQAAVKDCAALLPTKIKVATLSEKDANDMLRKGKAMEFKRAVVFKADVPKPSGIIKVADIFDSARKRAEWGLPWPWPSLTRMTFGRRRGELIGIGAGVGVGKCLGPDEPVLMHDGSTKRNADIRVGDNLMGPDGKARAVLSVTAGRAPMYKVVPVKGRPFVCNDVHVMSLKVSDKRYGSIGDVVDVPLNEYLAMPKRKRDSLKLWRTGVELAAQPVPVDPYIAGAYLGDGCKSIPRITLGHTKSAVLAYLRTWCESAGYELNKYAEDAGCATYGIVTRNNPSPFVSFVRTLVNENNERVIPACYLKNSSSVRREVLAGLIDTDGHMSHGCYDLVAKDRVFAEQVAWLARSVGLAAYVTAQEKGVRASGFRATYYRVTISGDIDAIPCKVPEKVAAPRRQKKSALVTGFSVEPLGEGDYYGYTLDGDGRYLLGDFTVTHNTNFWHQLIEHITYVDGGRVGVFMLEEAPAKTAKMIAGKFAGVQFHDPSAQYPQEVLDEALKKLEDKVILFRHEGAKDWEEIKQAIRFMVLVEGCKDIIIDPLSALTYHVDSSSANDLLNEIMGDLASLVHQLDFTCYYSSHLNPPQTGAPHEEGGRVKEHQFTGSRAMIKWSNYIIGLERNKQHEDERERNTTTCRLLKDREHGNAGTFPIYYDKQTGKYLEPSYEAPAGVTY